MEDAINLLRKQAETARLQAVYFSEEARQCEVNALALRESAAESDAKSKSYERAADDLSRTA